MKISNTSKVINLLKNFLLLILICSSYLIDVNCKTKKKITSSLANNKISKNKKFNKHFSSKNKNEGPHKHKKYMNYRFRRQGNEDDNSIKSIANVVKKALAIKVLKMKKDKLEKPKEGCLRLFDEPDFKSTNFKELCTETQFVEIAEIQKPSSILIADDIKLVFYRNDHDTANKNFKIIYNESKEIRNYPFNQNSTTYRMYKNIFVIKQGYVFISEKTLFQGKFKLTNSEMTDTDLGFNTIESIILGKNTFLNITLEGGKNIKITNDTFRNTFKNVKKIEIIIQDDIVVPEIDPDCIMIFEEPMFFGSGRQTPYSFCAETGKTNGIAKIPLAKIIKDAEKLTNTANLDNFEETLRLGIGSILVGSRVTAVAFQKPYLEGNAFLVKEMLLSSDHSEFEGKIKSLLILEPGCYIFFEDKNFEDKNGGFDILRLCSSINSYPISNWGHHSAGSLILGKNTVIEIYEKEDYQGKVTTISDSQRDLSVELFHEIGSIKIVNPTSNEIDLLSADFNNNGCLLIYDQENFQGNSKLLCDNKHINPDSYYKKKIKSFKITPGNHMVIQYNSIDYVFTYDRKVHAVESLQNIPNNKNAKFDRFDVLKETCIMLFEKCDYLGNFMIICEDVSDLSSESNRLNNYKSALVGKKAVVYLHNLINFTNKVGSTAYKMNDSITCASDDSSVKEVFENIASIEFEMSKNPQKSSEIPNTGNSVFNLIMGIILGLFNEDFKKKGSAESAKNTILKCIPDKFKKEIPLKEKNEVETSVIEYKKNSDSFFMKVLNGGGRILNKIITWFCNFKEKMFKYISYLADLMGWLPQVDKKEKEKTKKKEEVEEVKKNDKDQGEEKDVDKDVEKEKDESWLKKIKKGLETLEKNKDISEKAINFADKEIHKKISSTGQPLKPFQQDKIEKEKLYQESPKQKIALSGKLSQVGNKKNVKRLSPTKRKFRVRYSSIAKIFFGYLDRFKNWIIKQSKKLFAKYIVKAFYKVKSFFPSFIGKIEAFFKKPAVLGAIEAIGCAAYGIANIYTKVQAFISNVQIVILGISTIGTGLGILILIEFILSQLCNLKYLKLALNYYYLGNNIVETDKSLAFSYYGLAIGTTLNSIATAKSFTSKIKGLMKDNEDIDYDSMKSAIDDIKNWVYKGKN